MPGIQETYLKPKISTWVEDAIQGAYREKSFTFCCSCMKAVDPSTENSRCAWHIKETGVEGDTSSVGDRPDLLKPLGCCPHMLMILLLQTTSRDKQKRYYNSHFIGLINGCGVAKSSVSCPKSHFQHSLYSLTHSFSKYFFLSFIFLGLHPQHMEVSRLGV